MTRSHNSQFRKDSRRRAAAYQATLRFRRQAAMVSVREAMVKRTIMEARPKVNEVTHKARVVSWKGNEPKYEGF